MILFALLLLLPGLWRQSESLDEENEIQDEANVLITREQLAQLNESFEQGQISQTEFDTHRAELETALAKSLSSTARVTGFGGGRLAACVLAVFVPVSAGLLYVKLGMPEMLDPSFVLASSQSVQENQGEKLPSIEELLPQLTAHLEANPGDARGWRLLGTTYLRMQRFEDAEQALSKAFALDASDADLMLQLADAKAMVNDGQLMGEPQLLVERALLQRPDDVRGNWMLGIAYQQQGKPAQAVAVWEPLLTSLGNAPQARADLQRLINETRATMTPTTTSETANTDATQPSEKQGDRTDSPDPSNTSVSVSVTLDPALDILLPPDASVFIYAKASEGPPMPLAAIRKRVSDLPLEVVLDDSQAMMPALKLSGFEQVTVGARVSLSGNPVASDGDIFGEVTDVSVGQASQVLISLSQIVGSGAVGGSQ